MQFWFSPEACRSSMQGLFFGIEAAQSAEPWAKAVVRGNLELMSLASRRVQAYVEIPARLAACRTPQDVVGEQMRFWQTAVTQYSECCGCTLAAWRDAAAQTPWGLALTWAGTRGTSAPAQKRERDYISFRDPKEEAEAPSAPGKGERRAA